MNNPDSCIISFALIRTENLCIETRGILLDQVLWLEDIPAHLEGQICVAVGEADSVRFSPLFSVISIENAETAPFSVHF